MLFSPLKIKDMIKIPYGQSYFPTLPKAGMHFVDKTPFLETMEAHNSRFLFFFRPRRFGKSLWISVLQHYYGAEHAGEFQTLFGKYHVGRHPTPLANQYLVLKFDFSGIDTRTEESTYAGFLGNVGDSMRLFFGAYRHLFSSEEAAEILARTSPERMLSGLLALVENNAPEQKIYLLIDEYDHFANEILAFRYEDFLKAVGRNGFVRKFYETVKIAAQQGTVERLYITGTSSLTLDSLTSGFNIGTNITRDLEFHDLLGFDLPQTTEIMVGVGVPPEAMPKVLADLEKWYDGYAFHASRAGVKLFNSDMVLYFADHFSRRGEYPEEMLDVNIASDYGKIRQLFRVGGKEKERMAIMDKLIQEGYVAASLTQQFNFERGINFNDFVSLLFYQGMVTVTGMEGDRWKFSPPNAVIEKLYYEYFAQLLNERKEDAAKLETITDDARKQLQGYLGGEELRSVADLKGWLFVFVGAEAKVSEEVAP